MDGRPATCRDGKGLAPTGGTACRLYQPACDHLLQQRDPCGIREGRQGPNFHTRSAGALTHLQAQTIQPERHRATPRWWHAVPEPGAEPDRRVLTRLQRLLDGASGARLRALAHAVWSLSTLTDRNAGGAVAMIELSGTYVARGAGVGRGTAYVARNAIASATGMLVSPASLRGTVTLPARRCGHIVVLRRRALASVRVVARELLEAMDEPVARATLAPTGLLLPAVTRMRGKCRCPCDGHANGDANPSGLYDLRRRRLTCMTSGSRFALKEKGDRWIVLKRGSYCPDSESRTGNNRYPGETSEISSSTARPRRRTEHGPSTGTVLTCEVENGSWYRDVVRGSMPLVLARAQREHGSASESKRAWDAAYSKEREVAGTGAARSYPERLVSVGTYSARWSSSETCRQFGTGRVLFDLDGLACGIGWDWDRVCDAIRQVVPGRLFSHVEVVAETSSTGVQVLASLRLHEWDEARFYEEEREELRRVGAAVLAAVDRGGWVDESAWAPGRWARMPGARLKDNVLETATVRYPAMPAGWAVKPGWTTPTSKSKKLILRDDEPVPVGWDYNRCGCGGMAHVSRGPACEECLRAGARGEYLTERAGRLERGETVMSTCECCLLDFERPADQPHLTMHRSCYRDYLRGGGETPVVRRVRAERIASDVSKAGLDAQVWCSGTTVRVYVRRRVSGTWQALGHVRVWMDCAEIYVTEGLEDGEQVSRLVQAAVG